jgi:hypothetical protein
MHHRCVLSTGGAGCPCWLLLLHCLYASGLCWVFVGALHRVLALQVLGWVLQAFFQCCGRACMKVLQVSPGAWCIHDWLFVHRCGVVVILRRRETGLRLCMLNMYPVTDRL